MILFYSNFISKINIYIKYKKDFYLDKGKLPDFIIIGSQKAGTSSLFSNIRKHSMIEMCPKFVDIKNRPILNKEIHFFNNDKNWNKGIMWYKAMFNNSEKLQGEATPDYIVSEKIIKRMYETIPDAKLILILRNPVDRAYSSYNHQVQEGKVWGGLNTNNISYNKENSLISKGFYINQINNVLKYFKRDQLLIIISEEMKKDPQGVHDKVFDFLNIKREKIKYIPNIHKRKYTSLMKKSTRSNLEDIYKEYNEKLFNFLGYRIKDWESDI